MSLSLSLKLMKDVLARPSYQAAISISRTMSGSNKDNDKDPEKSINSNIPMVDFDDPDYLPLPQYPAKINEPLEQKRQRLLYQSRKRGMLENDLLLATFASKFLKNMDEEHLKLYDQLINGPTNDWDIYYWATGNKPTPEEYETSVMKMLKEHAKNVRKEPRLRQPNLY